MQYSHSPVAVPPARVPHTVAVLAVAALATVAALVADPALAVPGPLQVDFLANGTPMRCAAEDVAFNRNTTTQVSWRCAGSGTRFRCNMTSPGAFATDINLVALNCNALTEVPASNPPTLIKASGFEST